MYDNADLSIGKSSRTTDCTMTNSSDQPQMDLGSTVIGMPTIETKNF